MTASVLGLGELLWDLLPDGPRLGGAPFNVTANLQRLGHPARFATVVGADDLGRRALELVSALGVETGLIGVTDDAPTGTVRVQLDPSGNPRFDIVSPAAYESLALTPTQVADLAAHPPRALVFGTLAQRFGSVLDSTRRVIAATAAPYRLYDVNLREGCWSPELVGTLLGLATVVKVNETEARTLAAALDLPGEPEAFGEALAARHGVTAVCVTQGSRGAALWTEGTFHEVDAVPVKVVDAVGAGDAFAAALLDGLLEGRDPVRTLAVANRLGALVASRAGALPPWDPDEIRVA